jgi:hypothetical protein
MTKQTKEILKCLVGMIVTMIILADGCYSKQIGIEGKGIFLIMCSLYMAMWTHAGIISSRIENKLEKQLSEIRDAIKGVDKV